MILPVAPSNKFKTFSFSRMRLAPLPAPPPCPPWRSGIARGGRGRTGGPRTRWRRRGPGRHNWIKMNQKCGNAARPRKILKDKTKLVYSQSDIIFGLRHASSGENLR